MKIAIIGAMKSEIEFLLSKLENKQTKIINNFTFFLGTIEKIEIILVNSGIGKVMSGILIATLVNNFSIDKVINVGVAGGRENLNIADIVVGEACLFGDVDLTSIDDVPYGQMANFPLLFPADPHLLEIAKQLKPNFGIILTADKFVVDEVEAENLINKHFKNFNVLSYDMESAAFAQACYFFDIPFIAIRAISDIVGSKEQGDSYYQNLEKEVFASNDFIFNLIKKL